MPQRSDMRSTSTMPKPPPPAEVGAAHARIGLDAAVAHLDADGVGADGDAQLDLAVLLDAAVADAVGDDLGHEQLKVAHALSTEHAGQALLELTACVASRLLSTGEGDPEVHGAGHGARASYTSPRSNVPTPPSQR